MPGASSSNTSGRPGRPGRLARTRWLAALAPLLLASCGGGSSDGVPPPATCSVADQQVWLADYMNEWYFWYRLSPRPSPAAYGTVAGYFDALLYTGTDSRFPADRWSWYEPTETFNRFYGDGATMGYGLSVAGLEAAGQPGARLYVRHVEPLSDASAQGVQRGDEVRRLNGIDAATLIATTDTTQLTTLLTADREQQALTLLLRRNGADRTVTVTSKVFSLTPVAGAAVVTSLGGRRIGYVAVKDMISQSAAGLESAFATFRTQGVDEVVLDLRYNGGGLVSVGANVASYLAGSRGAGQAYANLLYNDKRASTNNQTFGFTLPINGLGLGRVFVLTGPRTCSASEQVINGLRGVGVQVVTVGDTTCGKPVGFLPTSQCGTTYNVVNFESVNARNEGRYFDGFDATCPVAEDFTVAQGAVNDPLLSTAAWYADTGSCSPTASARGGADGDRAAARRRAPRALDERTGMLGR